MCVRDCLCLRCAAWRPSALQASCSDCIALSPSSSSDRSQNKYEILLLAHSTTLYDKGIPAEGEQRLTRTSTQSVPHIPIARSPTSSVQLSPSGSSLPSLYTPSAAAPLARPRPSCDAVCFVFPSPLIFLQSPHMPKKTTTISPSFSFFYCLSLLPPIARIISPAPLPRCSRALSCSPAARARKRLVTLRPSPSSKHGSTGKSWPHYRVMYRRGPHHGS